MSTARKFLSIFTVAIAVFAFSTFAAAQNTTNDGSVSPTEKKQGKFGRRGMEGKRGMRGGRGMMGELRGLDLTDAQKDQIKAIHESFKASHEGQREEMRSLRMKKRDNSLTEADQARFQQLREQNKADMEQIHNSVLAILTTEQRQKVEERKAERQKRMGDRKERRQERKQNSPQDN